MPVTVRLSAGYFIGIALLSIMWGLGLILHFFVNSRVFPRVIDDEGITTRSGRRHLWQNLQDWERTRLVVGGAGGPRITGNVTFYFSTGKVLIGSFSIDNLPEVLQFLTKKLGIAVTPG